MRNKTSAIIAVVFFIVYTLSFFGGAMAFLGPTFGSKPNWVARFLAFIYFFPISELTFFFLFVNALFWTTMVYFLVFFIEKTIKFQRREVK